MGLFSWFSSKAPPSDTDVLEALAESIRARDEHLSEIRRREIRTSFLFTCWSIASWAVYLGLWFYSLLPPLEGRETPFDWRIPHSAEKAVYLTPVVIGPLIIYQTRRLVRSWYKRQETLEENQLKKLRGEQKKKLEEIKAKHNFDKTRELLERYGELPRREDPNASIRQRAITMSPSTPRTPARPVNQKPQSPFDPRSSGLPQLSVTPARPMPPPQRGWLDKVADKVLGEDDNSTVGLAQSRYALICEKCFSHNGLVKESEWEITQYVCPKCGHMNLSPKAKRAGISPITPPRHPMPTAAPGYPSSRLSHSPVPEISEPPSQDDHPSQDQPAPEEMDVDSSSS